MVSGFPNLTKELAQVVAAGSRLNLWERLNDDLFGDSVLVHGGFHDLSPSHKDAKNAPERVNRSHEGDSARLTGFTKRPS
jgi:hypothetical protein